MSRLLFCGLFLFFPTVVIASPSPLPGETFSLVWMLPFIIMLASIALCPLVMPRFWQVHYGKVSYGLAGITFLTLANICGGKVASLTLFNTLFHDYFPFIIMIGALYTVAGGIQVRILSPATPLTNTLFLAFGTFLAGWIGTTGASMLLIRAGLSMNEHRKAKVHFIIFFIFLIANIGGALTPLGDPPLFLGFLNGVDFFWTLKNLSLDMLLTILPLLFLFLGIDSFLEKREHILLPPARFRLDIKGAFNGFFFLGIISLVLLSGVWTSAPKVRIGDFSLDLQNILRDGGLLGLAALSYARTPTALHKANQFSWEPLEEVAKLFLGIFITAIPVVAILQAGPHGAFAPLLKLVGGEGAPNSLMYFWLSGGLSSFLDNAPTYLVFFYVAGGEASVLMNALSQTLVALSLGAVFMGAMTYIGNAPNFMVKTIAESQKIKMPSFLGYMVWSAGILLPLFFLLSWWRL